MSDAELEDMALNIYWAVEHGKVTQAGEFIRKIVAFETQNLQRELTEAKREISALDSMLPVAMAREAK